MQRRLQQACLCLFVFASSVFAQTAPKPHAAVTAIHAGRLIDVRTGEVTEGAWIITAEGRITSVATSAPAGATVIDWSRYTVVPGLIDAHAHILSDPTTQSATAGLRLTAADDTVRGVANLRLWLKHGFVVVRDACEGDPSYPQFALRRGVEKGLIPGPHIVSAGGCISMTGGHGDGNVLAPDKPLVNSANIADTVDDIDRVVRRDIKFGADWIKLMASGGVMDPISDYRVQELSEEQMARAVEVAHRAGKKVMAHAEGTAGIHAAVLAGVDSVEHGTLLDDETAQMMAQKGTWLVPTLYCFQHDLETGESLGRDPGSMAKGIAIVKEQGPAFARALKYHVKIGYGVDDADVDESVSKEFGALVRGGMTTLGALQAATINNATLLSLDHDYGTLEAGKFADLVALPGDPLKDITVMEHVAGVVQHGRLLQQ